MQRGDIVVAETNGVWGRLIRLATRDPRTHAAICVGASLIAEVSANYPARIAPLGYDRYTVLRVPDLTEAQQDAVCAWVQHHLGARYDWPAIFLIALRLLTGIRIRHKPSRRFECVEFALSALAAAGVQISADEMLTPGELLTLDTLVRADEEGVE